MRGRLKADHFTFSGVLALFGLILFLGGTLNVNAAELLPFDELPRGNSGKTYTKKYINYAQSVLDENDEITFRAGETYVLEGALRIPSGRNITINAEGATIEGKKGLIANDDVSKTNYSSISGLTINGGTWIAGKKSGAIKLAHGQNITLTNMTLTNPSADSHAIELVACKNVLIDNCIVESTGSSNGREEQIQLDVASMATASDVLVNKNGKLVSKAVNGATCQDVTISNCTVTGNRAIGVNADVATATGKGKTQKGKYANKYHKNINIIGNTLTGKKAEGLMAYNIINLKVEDNTITSKASVKKEYYSCGIHVLNQGKGKKMTCSIKNNKVSGGVHAIFVANNGAKIKKATVTGNTVSCKKGKKTAVRVDALKSTVKDNS